MAAAYAALLAVARSLREILDLDKYIDPLHKEKFFSLKEKVDFIVSFLEDFSDKYQETLGLEGNGIRKAAYEAQDFMDSYQCSEEADLNLDRDLTMASERIGFIWEEMMKMNNGDTAKDLRSVSYSFPVDRSSTVQATAKKMVVGFDDDLLVIKERLYEDSAKLQIIPVVGMGGIGKTTLARKAYDDSILSQYFDKCAWITVSQEYQRREVLSGLLKSLKNEQSNENEAELAKLVYQSLFGRRYLIVIDDIWSTKAWDDFKVTFPDDGSGSRILLTTRLLDVASHARSSDAPVHQMKCLNNDQSWKLLQESVLEQQSCPLQLVEVGKKIAENCGGLPLTIVVVAGLLLSSGNVMREEVWENVSENISSKEPTIALQCSKILCFSYDRLPLRLKPCFLYIAAFPEDSEIDVSKLIKLWVAEGFLKPNDQFKWLEDVGEHYLEDLVNRSLLLVSKKGPDGKLETVGIHDMLREICITKAEEEGFLHGVSSKTNSRTEIIGNPYRRLRIHCTEHFQEWKILDSSVRSVLFFSEKYQRPRIDLRSRHVGVLDAPQVTWPKLSHVISTFVNLRYFAFKLDDACPDGFPVSISKHPNLETIVVYLDDIALWQLPYEMLKMPKLRHLIWNDYFHFSYPSDIGIVYESDLQTIETVVDFIFTKEIIKILVNMKKLKVAYFMKNHDWDYYNLENLCHLQSLEDLQISMRCWPDPSMTWNHAFPIGLKKLSLRGVFFPWENMTIIGSLPNLQVLEMTSIAVNKVSKWVMMEGQFLQLKYFHSSLDSLSTWEMEKEHFPCLESLILERPEWINEIPSGIGEIETLRYIELRGCKTSLVISAKQMQKHQHENGNNDFHVRVFKYYSYEYLGGSHILERI
ncbi:putative late blight resistance protein homolog R1A-3 isoform X2 [Primulina eburnea]|uniref:putative late blight resistance protein homolog R1A-3 isoform X2 n=1 Tax=Primulina eburnea TaxID=1245227 RepID=UPI003C6C83A5